MQSIHENVLSQSWNSTCFCQKRRCLPNRLLSKMNHYLSYRLTFLCPNASVVSVAFFFPVTRRTLFLLSDKMLLILSDLRFRGCFAGTRGIVTRSVSSFASFELFSTSFSISLDPFSLAILHKLKIYERGYKKKNFIETSNLADSSIVVEKIKTQVTECRNVAIRKERELILNRATLVKGCSHFPSECSSLLCCWNNVICRDLAAGQHWFWISLGHYLPHGLSLLAIIRQK